MKIFLYLVLALHILMEGVVGLILLFSPATFAPEVSGAGVPYLMYYGAAGITVALAAAWFWPHRANPVALSITLGLLATFHSLLMVAGVLVTLSGDGIHIVISHGLLALGFWILWLRRHGLARP